MTAIRKLVTSAQIAILIGGSGWTARVAFAQDPKPGDPDWISISQSQAQTARVGSSPFAPPDESDTVFVVDEGSGLDTGCAFRSGGPLVFSVGVDRVIGDLDRLRARDLISKSALLRMPAFDVDIDADVSNIAPEFNRVTFNGHVVPGEFLTGSNNIWKLNVFEVPIDWVKFPPDPGPGGTPEPALNTFRIDIDVANSNEYWCTAIDWAAISFEVARPVVMVHGIRSSGATWAPWVARFDALGLLNSNRLDLGAYESISANAGKIAAEIADVRSRWGVEKVNLIGHSKGGLDARHYVEKASDVEQLIQLGTPNAGTLVADAAQAGTLLLSGIAGTALINTLAAPAGVQLTTRYMDWYNRMHGSNPKVRYMAVAGDYDPDCSAWNPLCRPTDRLLLSLSGRPGDTIVSAESVHALPYADNRIHVSIGDDRSATHTAIHSNDLVFESILFERVANYRSAAISGRPGEPSRTAIVGGLLQIGESFRHRLPIDQAGTLVVSLMYADGEIGLTLVSPTGEVIDPDVSTLTDRIKYEARDILGGRMAVYAIDAAEAGEWTAQVTGDAISGAAAYGINAWIEDADISLHGEVVETVVRNGRPMVIRASVDRAAKPLLGVSVSATVAGPDGWIQTIDLLDDGLGEDAEADDGIYTGMAVETAQVGLYRVAFVASGAPSATDPEFSREDFALAAVSASASRFVGAYKDAGIDTNGNGLFDQLVVEAEVTVTDSTAYRILGVLMDSKGNRHEASIVTMLTEGSQMVHLAFDGSALHRNGIDGPYRLIVVRLAEEGADPLELMPVDEVLDAHLTQVYSHKAFEHSPLLLTGEGSSVGVDTDGNGRFDRVDVRIGMALDVGGFYQWSARLADREGAELGFHAGSGNLSAGQDELTFRFPGEPIGRNGLDGPYYVSDLLLFGVGHSLVAGRVFTTDPFAARQFEGFNEDTDGDGIPNDLDGCPKSNLEPTVLIDGCDSRVSNVLEANGCSIADQVRLCATGATNHGGFVSCVADFNNELMSNGILSGAEKDAIQRCSARAKFP
jgi:pimeloyl-ACP methyl ester carboxylesterase